MFKYTDVQWNQNTVIKNSYEVEDYIIKESDELHLYYNFEIPSIMWNDSDPIEKLVRVYLQKQTREIGENDIITYENIR